MTRNPLTDGDTVLASLWGSMMNAHGAEAVLNGVAPSVGTGNWDVDTTAGDAFINGTTASVGADTTTLTDPASDADLDSGEFRVDLLTVDATGTINVAEGTAAALPISPDIPTDEAVICGVVVSGDATSLQAGDIRDYRTLLESDKDRYVDGGPHEIDAVEFAGGDGTAGDLLTTDGAALSYATRSTIVSATTATETGSFSTGGGGSGQTTTISTSNAYTEAQAYAWILRDGVGALDTIVAWAADLTTDGSGDYDGVTIEFDDGGFSDATVHWRVMGVVA